MQDEHIKSATDKMDKTIAAMIKDFAHIRAGRANSQLLDSIRVDYYGTPTPLTQMCNVSTPEPRMLVIAPYDASQLKEICKAIQKSELGINPVDDGKFIKLVFPELTSERRQELVKQIKKKGEDGKVAVRNVRRDTKEDLKKLQKSSDITEDDFDRLEKDLQKQTDDYITKIDKIVADKEKEILSV